MSTTYEQLKTSGDYQIVSALGTSILFIGIIIAILTIVSNWILFKRAGEKSWYSIIPLLSQYKLIKIAKGERSLLWFILMFVPIANIIITVMVLYKFAQNFTKKDDSILPILNLLCPFIVGPILAFGKYKKYTNPIDGSDRVIDPSI